MMRYKFTLWCPAQWFDAEQSPDLESDAALFPGVTARYRQAIERSTDGRLTSAE